jgi:hypothetical protein
MNVETITSHLDRLDLTPYDDDIQKYIKGFDPGVYGPTGAWRLRVEAPYSDWLKLIFEATLTESKSKTEYQNTLASVAFHQQASCCAIIHAHWWICPHESLARLFSDTIMTLAYNQLYTVVQCELTPKNHTGNRRVYEYWQKFYKPQEYSFKSRRTGATIHVLTADARQIINNKQKNIYKAA